MGIGKPAEATHAGLAMVVPPDLRAAAASFLPAFAIERSTREQSINKLPRNIGLWQMY
jgi:hypothetical protein